MKTRSERNMSNDGDQNKSILDSELRSRALCVVEWFLGAPYTLQLQVKIVNSPSPLVLLWFSAHACK